MDTLKQSPPKKRWISKAGMDVVHQLLNSQLETGFKQCAIMRTTDITEQARRLPTSFVGECAYLFMCKAKNQKDVTGDYQIVFAKTGTRARQTSEHFTPSVFRKITVKTDIRKTHPGIPTNHVLRGGAWGALEVKFDQYRACIGLDAPVRDNYYEVPVRVVHQEPGKHYEDDEDHEDRESTSKLERILARGIDTEGDTQVFFGLKELESRDPQGDRNTCLGFRFLELEVDYVDPDSGTVDRLVIVAVKLSDEVRDVGSAFILAQRVHYPGPEMYDWSGC